MEGGGLGSPWGVLLYGSPFRFPEKFTRTCSNPTSLTTVYPLVVTVTARGYPTTPQRRLQNQYDEEALPDSASDSCMTASDRSVETRRIGVGLRGILFDKYSGSTKG